MFAYDAAGNETYLGGHSSLSINVDAADSYRVEHWLAGQTNANCDGPGGGGGGFECSFANGVLSWDDAGASQYFVFSYDAAGNETYLGGHSSTSLSVAAADSYRVEHWLAGPATNALCGNAGGGFSCSVANGVLTWTDVGASDYFVFQTIGGTESYLGGHQGTSLNVDPADSYRVEHWLNGPVTNAIC